MKRIRVNEFGGAEAMRLEDFTPGDPGPGQARVKMAAAGVNFIDIYQRRGEYGVKAPWTPGLEGAGIIEALGEGVSGHKVGDRVAFTSQPGSYAEANVVKADALLPLPQSLSWEQGASYPLQGMTAHYLIYEYRKPQRGDDVLIHAAAGGMGLLLVQWAKHFGARVIGTVSTEEKAQIAREAGADDVIIYSKEDFVTETKKLTGGKGADLIIDGVGKTTFAGSLDACAVRGHVVIYGAASGAADPIRPNDLQRKSLTVCGGSLFNYTLTRDELLMRANDVLAGIQEGWLKLRIDHVMPLAEAPEAHRMLEGRQTIGKVVLKAAAL